MNVQIRVATADEIRSGYVGQQLREFNNRAVGGLAEVETIYLNAIDENGVVVGGLWSCVYLQWLRIELLWMQEQHRGRGIGSNPLQADEDRGKGVGALNALLETFEWQAPLFYQRHHYAEVARIGNYVAGHCMFTMRMVL